MTTMTEPRTRTYTPVQQAARDYMEAQNVLDALKEQGAASETAKKAALATLMEAFPVWHIGDKNVGIITGCWNDNLKFENRLDRSTKWAKVLEGLRPHLTATQCAILDNLEAGNTNPRKYQKLAKA